jgi:DegV family protein with EDD domain
VAVVTDSTADLLPELVARRSLSVVPLTVTLDGESLLDGVDIAAADFYRRLPASSTHPTTSQPSPGRFAEVYRRLLEDHDEVVSVHISSKLSGTFASAQQGAELAGSDRIRVFDSEFASMPLGALVLVAAAAAERGADGSEVVAKLARVREATRCFFAVSTLEYLRRGGRIGSARAMLGSVLQIKPILAIERGEVVPLEQVRTQGRALNRLVELAESCDRGGGLCLVIGHAGAEEVAIELAERLEPRAESLLIQPLGPVVGAHAGPGTVGIAAYPAELFPLGLGRMIPATASR